MAGRSQAGTSRWVKALAQPLSAKEELDLDIDVRNLLVLDWAPHPNEGDKRLIIFDGGELDQATLDKINFTDGELSAAQFFTPDELSSVLPDRLAKRVYQAARGTGSRFLEHGQEPGQ